MTSYKIHIIIGLIVSAVAMVFFWQFLKISWQQLPIITFIIFVYSQLPDADHAGTAITWLLISTSAGVGWVGYILENMNLVGVSLLLLSITIFSVIFLKHRGPTHTVWFCIASPFLLLLMPDLGLPLGPVMVLAGIACYSHLLADGYFFKISLKPKKSRL